MKINNARAHYVTPAKVVGSSVYMLVLLALIGWMEMLREISSTITLALGAGENNRSRSSSRQRRRRHTQFFSHLPPRKAISTSMRRATSYFVCGPQRSHHGACLPGFSLQCALADFLFSLGWARSRDCAAKFAHHGILTVHKLDSMGVAGLMRKPNKV